MVRTLALALLLATSLRCAAAPLGLGGVRVTSNVAEAELFVDEELLGTVEDYADHFVRLAPGAYALRLEHPDYFAEEINVNVVSDVAVTVAIELRRRHLAER